MKPFLDACIWIIAGSLLTLGLTARVPITEQSHPGQTVGQMILDNALTTAQEKLAEQTN